MLLSLFVILTSLHILKSYKEVRNSNYAHKYIITHYSSIDFDKILFFQGNVITTFLFVLKLLNLNFIKN